MSERDISCNDTLHRTRDYSIARLKVNHEVRDFCLFWDGIKGDTCGSG